MRYDISLMYNLCIYYMDYYISIWYAYYIHKSYRSSIARNLSSQKVPNDSYNTIIGPKKCYHHIPRSPKTIKRTGFHQRLLF